MLIGITSAENVHQISSLNQADTVIGVDTLKLKFFDPLIKCANIFLMPRDSTITALLASMLLRLSGNSQVVAYFFREWQDFVQTKRDQGYLMQGQLEADREDDLKIVKKVANLYSRSESALTLKALKTLKKVYTSEVFLKMLTFNPKHTIIMGLINLVLGIERRFKVSEEAKVPKELLVQTYPQIQLTHTLSSSQSMSQSQ